MTNFDHSPSDAAAVAIDPVTSRYGNRRVQKCEDENWLKLKALVRLLGLTPTQVARAAGVSRPYASRLLNERDPLVGSSIVYRRLEARLGALVDGRSRQFFAVEAVSVDGAETVLHGGRVTQ